MSDPAYTIEPRDKTIEVTHALLDSEIRPGNTVTFVVDVDLTAIERAQVSRNDDSPTLTAFVVKAVALALRDFPYANGRVHRVGFPWPGPRLQKFTRADVAAAAGFDVPGADADAVVKLVRDADRLSTAAIDAALAGPVDARAGGYAVTVRRWPVWVSTILIRLPWFVPRLWVERRGGAALVSTAGDDVADAVIGAWSYPLGVSIGRVEPRPVVRDGAVLALRSCTLTLNFDRRVMAGAQAARFFRRVVERLERPEPVPSPAAPTAPALER